MTNLNSISSSLSSIDTVGHQTKVHAQSNQASVENLVGQRSTYIDTTGLLWNKRLAPQENPYAVGGSVLDGTNRTGNSDIYYSRKRKSCCDCFPSSVAASNLVLVPLLLLTLVRQVFDFLGQIWLQIIINFITLNVIIVALFGIKQGRISYLLAFVFVCMFNIFWNIVVISIHFKTNDLREDLLSLFTGATSWWHLNGPGCLPYTITTIQPSINNIIKSNMMSGCRIDYHLIEATQAAVHCALSFIALITSCCTMATIRRNPKYFKKKNQASDRVYRMNDLATGRINHDPLPDQHTQRNMSSNTNSLSRAVNKASVRSSQHSIGSTRSARRRRPSNSDNNGAVLPTPRGSRSSMNRSKYGSLSSRRSNRFKDRTADESSLTYGSTAAKRVSGANQRTRLSSVSSTEYLPSYQPPHTSSANLLSSYGELSSVESYNNTNNEKNSASIRRTRQSNYAKTELKGNTNPVYQGSRSSVCSQNLNNDNYDDISYIYGNRNTPADGVYGQSQHRRKQGYSKLRSNNEDRPSQSNAQPEEIQVETYHKSNRVIKANGETTSINGPNKSSQPNGNTFQSFSNPTNQTNYMTNSFTFRSQAEQGSDNHTHR